MILNLWVRPEALAAAISRMAADPRLGVAPLAPEVVVVDYSAPNVAKEMHVGHLRSTIIGDCLVRLLDFGGQKVVRQNHIGDWGTPFGMLIERLVDLGIRDPSAPSLADLGAFYREARAAFDTDPAFAERARRRVVALQAGSNDFPAAQRRAICNTTNTRYAPNGAQVYIIPSSRAYMQHHQPLTGICPGLRSALGACRGAFRPKAIVSERYVQGAFGIDACTCERPYAT
jgi:hypothetical protein